MAILRAKLKKNNLGSLSTFYTCTQYSDLIITRQCCFRYVIRVNFWFWFFFFLQFQTTKEYEENKKEQNITENKKTDRLSRPFFSSGNYYCVAVIERITRIIGAKTPSYKRPCSHSFAGQRPDGSAAAAALKPNR